MLGFRVSGLGLRVTTAPVEEPDGQAATAVDPVRDQVAAAIICPTSEADSPKPLKTQGLGLRVYGLGFRVLGLGFRV